MPGRKTTKAVWFSRPGTASTLIPRDGTAQECSTSWAETKIRIGDSCGITMRLSVSNNRSSPGKRSDVESI